MNDKKMIIRNCPAYSETQGVYWTCYEDNNKLLCQDCTSCVMNQVVELCKNKNYFVKRFPNAQFSSAVQNSELAFDILQLLDIQEVE